MWKLSIVIPAWGPQQQLDDTLLSVLENRPPDCQIVLAHAPDYADPYGLEDELELVECRGSSLEFLYHAIAAARADIVHLLCPGTYAYAGWQVDAVNQLASSDRTMAVAPLIRPCSEPQKLWAGIRYSLSGRRCVIEQSGRHSESRRPRVDAPCLQAGFYRRPVLLKALRRGPTLKNSYWIDAHLARSFRRGRHAVRSLATIQMATESDAIITGWQSAFDGERLFWHHVSSVQLPIALPGRMLEIARESMGNLPAISAMTGLAGHLCGTASACLRRSSYQIEQLEEHPPRSLSMATVRDKTTARESQQAATPHARSDAA